jgi:hypothetical protein
MIKMSDELQEFKFEVSGYVEVLVKVKPDWSGLATIFWITEEGREGQIQMPGEILRKIAAQEGIKIINRNVEKFLESLKGQPS